MRGRAKIMVVDDDRTTRRIMRHWLEGEGFAVTEHASAAEAKDGMRERPAVACIDLGLGSDSGLDLMGALKASDPDLVAVIVTARSDASTAVEAMRAGAYDYVTKPIDRDRLLTSVRRATEHRMLVANVAHLNAELRDRRGVSTLVGDGPAMQRLADQIVRVFDSDVPVCITGESGTGKELVARAVHEGGRRASGPFVAVNCGAIPESLQEAELFGAERGAFTGAHATRPGRFEQAIGGTLFLDELGEMSASTQAALLRTLQERRVRRVGGTAEIEVDTRVVCATHRDLEALVASGAFREDLYFRLVVYPVHVPPLRERREDIPALVAHFLRKLAADVGRRPDRIAPAAMAALVAHPWPGNVRELQNAIHRAMLACDGATLERDHLPPTILAASVPPAAPGTAISSSEPAPLPGDREELFDLKVIERRTIRRALAATGGNMSEAARLLGIGRATLYRKVASYDVIDAA
ncbi:MAG: sigma-54 dependent transcriptional regulator [Myxococcota bacterium]